MAKKKGNYGTNNYAKPTSKKRPHRHSKSPSKRIPNKKKTRGQGR